MIHNPYGLKIRPEKQIAEVLKLSRSQVQRMIREGEMEMEKISMRCDILSDKIKGDMYNKPRDNELHVHCKVKEGMI